MSAFKRPVQIPFSRGYFHSKKFACLGPGSTVLQTQYRRDGIRSSYFRANKQVNGTCFGSIYPQDRAKKKKTGDTVST